MYDLNSKQYLFKIDKIMLLVIYRYYIQIVD